MNFRKNSKRPLTPSLIFVKLSYKLFSSEKSPKKTYIKNLQRDFLVWKWPPPPFFGSFPKIHPFWYPDPSLNVHKSQHHHQHQHDEQNNQIIKDSIFNSQPSSLVITPSAKLLTSTYFQASEGHTRRCKADLPTSPSRDKYQTSLLKWIEWELLLSFSKFEIQIQIQI